MMYNYMTIYTYMYMYMYIHQAEVNLLKQFSGDMLENRCLKDIDFTSGEPPYPELCPITLKACVSTESMIIVSRTCVL